MLEQLTASVLADGVLTLSGVLFCSVISIILGLGIAGVYTIKNRFSKGLFITLAMLPLIVQMVIMMVNGSIGTGVAVAGAFSLVRFRSVPGTARDIIHIFFAMAIGLATGMGFLFFALIFFIIAAAASVILVCCPIGERQQAQVLKVTIPENLDYETIFDDLFVQYAQSAQLRQVKTTNMGSLFDLNYEVILKEPNKSKEFLDALRCRNGNLSITLVRPVAGKEEL